MKILSPAGMITMLVGAFSANPQVGVAGLAMMTYASTGLAPTFLVVALAEILVTGYALGGFAGFGVALFLVASFVGIYSWWMTFKDPFPNPPYGYRFGKEGAVVFERRFDSALDAILQKQRKRTYARGADESPKSFEYRKIRTEQTVGYSEFEVEGIMCELRFAHRETCNAEVHRVIEYRTRAKQSQSVTKSVVELKLKRLINAQLEKKDSTSPHTSECASNKGYSASLVQGKEYVHAGPPVIVHGVTFYQLIDETNEAYLYPSTLFRQSSAA